jgi:hypothetical protein
MRRVLIAVCAAGALCALTTRPAAASSELFTSALRGNIANQQIVGFAASTATWAVRKGFVSILPFGKDRALVVVGVKGLIIPALGFNPSPDVLARIVCHDQVGAVSEAARTRTAPLSRQGDGTVIDVVSLPGTCFAPIVFLTGSRDPEGQSPGKFFAVTGF